MKVLWFTTSPSIAEEKLDQKITHTGWIKALDSELQSLLELHVCFYNKSNKPAEQIKLGLTTYHPIPKPRMNFLVRHYTNFLEPREEIQKYLAIIEKVNPDIIHIHGTENPFGDIIDKVSSPVVVSIQGNLTVIRHKFFCGLPKWTSVVSPKMLNNIYQHTYYRTYRKFKNSSKREQRVMKKAKHIIGRTDWDRRISRIQSPNSIYHHNDEVLRKPFYANQWQGKRRNNQPYLIHSTLSKGFYKGFETISQCATLLESVGFEFQWNIAGLNKNDQLVKITSDYLGANSKSINFLGNLDEVDLVSSMLKADLYVLSSHIENSSNSLCEAMLLGMPCIAALAGGTLSLLEPNKEGVMIQTGDPWSLGGAIVELLEDKKRCVELGQAARARALKRHDPLRISTELKNIYQEVIKLSKDSSRTKNKAISMSKV